MNNSENLDSGSFQSIRSLKGMSPDDAEIFLNIVAHEGLKSELDRITKNMHLESNQRGGIVQQYLNNTNKIRITDFAASSIALLKNEFITQEQYFQHISKISTRTLITTMRLLHFALYLENLDNATQSAFHDISSITEIELAKRSYRCEIDSDHDDGKELIPRIRIIDTPREVALESIEPLLAIYDFVL
jgi:hypothetical protein